MTTTSISINIVNCKDNEDFFMSLLNSINTVRYFSRQSDLKVLAKLCSLSDNEGNVSLSPLVRKSIITTLNMSTQSLSNSLKRLKDSSLLIGKSQLEVLPHKLWEGTSSERNRILATKEATIILKLKHSTNV